MSNPMDAPDDWGLDLQKVREQAKLQDTGRWDWHKIDCCFTGKNADLDLWGQQGVEIVSCDEDGVRIVARGLKAEAGIDVCLNLRPDDDPDTCLDTYLDLAQEVISDLGGEGAWDGDCWILTFSHSTVVPWVYQPDGVTPDYEGTFNRCAEKAQELIQPWEDQMWRLSETTNRLAGWTDLEGKQLPEGQPGSLAAWLIAGEAT